MPYINTNGIRLYYAEEGSGEPLIMIMGITADGSVWEKHVAYWKQYFRCIMPDNRGVGLSDKPVAPYTAAQMADDYAGLIDALQLGVVRLVGCSMGSIIAQQLMLRHPQKVSSCVLMCPWARCDNMAKGIFQNIINLKAALNAEAFSLYIQLLIFSKSYWDNPENAISLESDRKHAALVENPQPLHGLMGQAAACISHNVLHDLPAIFQPVLVIGGSSDIFTPTWMAEEIAEALPNSTLQLYEGCGHAFHWEALADFNPRVVQWLLSH